MKLTAHWPNDLEMPKVVHNVQFTMTNVQSVLMIGQSVVEFIEVFRSMTNCRICRRIVMEHWPNANEKRCIRFTYALESMSLLEIVFVATLGDGAFSVGIFGMLGMPAWSMFKLPFAFSLWASVNVVALSSLRTSFSNRQRRFIDVFTLPDGCPTARPSALCND